MIKVFALVVLALQGCAVVAEYPVTSASLAVMGATGKGPTDHALSYVAERDCATLRVIDGNKICQDYVAAPVVDRTTTKVYKTTAVASANDVFAKRATMHTKEQYEKR
jgi:hypothetical protein